MRVGLAGAFKFIVEHGDTGIIKYESPWYKNLITDRGLNQLGWGFDEFRVALGSGAAAPTYASTALANWLTTSASSSYWMAAQGYNVIEGYAYSRYNFTFNIGQVQGTITEIGITGNYTTVPTYLYTYSTLNDANGNPTSLTLGGIDRLTLTYEFRQYWPTADLEFTATLNGELRNCISIAAQFTHWSPGVAFFAGPRLAGSSLLYRSATLGAIGSLPSGSAKAASQMTAHAYVSGTYQREVTLIWDIYDGNLVDNNILLIRADSNSGYSSVGGAWQISFDPPITKTEFENFSLTVRLHWGRYVP